jgi:hypothetical protein
MYLLFIWRGTYRNGFEACNIHYSGHWNLEGVGLEIEIFLGPEMATSEASAIYMYEVMAEKQNIFLLLCTCYFQSLPDAYLFVSKVSFLLIAVATIKSHLTCYHKSEFKISFPLYSDIFCVR